MQYIVNFFEMIKGLGSNVMVPLTIMIIALIFRLNWVKAIKAGLTVGVGFIGMNLILNILWDFMIPVSDILLERFGLNRPYVDAGGGAAGVIAFGTTVGTIIIPFILVINILMLVTRTTKTINIDIWNFWHLAFTGSVITLVAEKSGASPTEAIVYGLIGAATHSILALLIADLTAKRIQEEFRMPGVSISQGFAITTVPIVLLLDKLYNLIKPPKKAVEGEKKAVKRPSAVASLFGEPIIIGALLGIVLGVAVGYSFQQTAELAVQLAALMLLLPRMIKIIVEGLLPVSDAARAFMSKRYGDREFYIGLDSAVLLGHPTTLIASIILIPIVLVLAMVLPWNTTLPVADLAATAFFVSMATPIHKNSLVKTVISGTVIFTIVLSISSYFGPMITEVARATGYAFPEGATGVTAMSAGNWFAWVISMIMRLKWFGAILCAIIIGGAIYLINVVALKVYTHGKKKPAEEKANV
ncbi:PTS galactitol transporter subunit IIC [Feifania hominis]|uniref:PTS EIIC type-2 domain-containing protein n=1 Tax=Feifania hominis TaxID=2763660 RepID=A0A926DCX8_9FIRM|nr:PTS transporter subunit IIC [Feifania hominis]MBC8536665.1 hypothetical protein [Feifania hominis]